MIKLSLLSSFLFFLLLLTISPPANSSRNESVNPNPRIVKAPSVVIVTDVVIQNICSQTGEPRLCQLIINQFKGKTLFPKPLANVMGLVKGHAKTTAKKIWGLYDGIKDQYKFELKTGYLKCLTDYTNAMNLLAKANKFMVDGKIKPLRHYAILALTEVRPCNQEFAKQRHEPSGLAKDNKKFNDLCSILLVICGTLKMKLRVG